jgi:serine/threonine protein phosphatase PrpC
MLYVLEDIGGREYQEDRHCVKINLYKGYDYIAIFDGHGGYQVSEFLKFHLKDYVKKHLALGKHPKKALSDAFNDAHDSMSIEMSYMTGSAVVVILKKDDEIWVANSGDSRAIMGTIMNKKRPISLSIDHKPDRPDELQRIIQLGGKVTMYPRDVPRVQGNLALSRSIGDKYLAPYVICDPEIKHFKIEDLEAKYIILATDGLWDVLSNQDVVNITTNVMIEKHANSITKNLITDVIHTLLRESRMRGSQDNTSIIFWLL